MLPIDKDKKELGRGFHCYWSELPLDLKVEILCRLPHKPLIRLKCVSKSWYFLISNQCVPKISTSVFCGMISTIHVPEDSFSYLHFDSDNDYSLHSPQVRLQNAITNVLRIILPFKHEAQELQDCCNGLMLLARFVSSSIPTQYYVCNPITYECITIPVHLNHLKQEDSCVSSLVFDPNYPSSFMIITRREYSQYLLKIDIFSSTSGNWSSHVVPLDHALDGFKLIDRAIYLNGVIYMLSLAKYLICIYLPVDEANSESISSRAIALPGKDEFDSCGAFGVSGGNLVYSNSGNSKTLVWMLQGCIRWVLKHRIKHAEFINQFSPARYNWYHKHSNCRPMKVYAFHPNSEEIIMGSPVMLLKYNPKTKHVQIYHTWPSSGSRYISRGQQKVFPLSRCPVILRSVIRNQ